MEPTRCGETGQGTEEDMDRRAMAQIGAIASTIKRLKSDLTASERHAEYCESSMTIYQLRYEDEVKSKKALQEQMQAVQDTLADVTYKSNVITGEAYKKAALIESLQMQLQEELKKTSGRALKISAMVEKARSEEKAASETAMENLKASYTKRTQQLQTRHAIKLKRLKAEHAQAIDRFHEQHAAGTTELLTSHKAALEDLENASRTARRLLRDDCHAKMAEYKGSQQKKLKAVLDRSEGVRQRRKAMDRRKAAAWKQLRKVSEDLDTAGKDEEMLGCEEMEVEVELWEALGCEAPRDGDAGSKA